MYFVPDTLIKLVGETFSEDEDRIKFGFGNFGIVLNKKYNPEDSNFFNFRLKRLDVPNIESLRNLVNAEYYRNNIIDVTIYLTRNSGLNKFVNLLKEIKNLQYLVIKTKKNRGTVIKGDLKCLRQLKNIKHVDVSNFKHYTNSTNVRIIDNRSRLLTNIIQGPPYMYIGMYRRYTH